MEKFKTLADAVALAEFAHRNQVDQAGFPYIDHPKAVLASVQAMGAAPYVQIAAVLHDVPEDTAVSHDMIDELGFSPAVTKLTRLLDRNYSEWKYFHDPDGPLYAQDGTKAQKEYFYYQDIAEVPEAKMIKKADIRHNLTPWRLSHLPEKRQTYLIDKYDRALRLLDAD
jgi:(p)ppGpp synthase/HD superfamily hydrolase